MQRLTLRGEDATAFCERRRRYFRQAVKPQPRPSSDGTHWTIQYHGGAVTTHDPAACKDLLAMSPYHVSGKLFVAEEWALATPVNEHGSVPVYRATWETYKDGFQEAVPLWRPADKMPPYASRLVIEVTDVFVRRIQDHGPWATEADLMSPTDTAWRENVWIWVVAFDIVREGRAVDRAQRR